jgi:hypothetical protein
MSSSFIIGFISFLCVLSVVKCTKNIKNLMYTFEVENNQVFCLFNGFNSSIEYLIEYGVLKGGNLDIYFSVEAVKGSKKIHSELGNKKANYFIFFSSLNTDYKFCFDNKFSSISHKKVYFSLKPVDERFGENLKEELAEGDQAAAPYVMRREEAILNKLHSKLNNVSYIQSFYRHEEALDRAFAENLNEKVMIFSLINFSWIICVSFVQVYSVKKLFESKIAIPSSYTAINSNSKNLRF